MDNDEEYWERPAAPKTKFKKQAKRFLGYLEDGELEAWNDEEDEFDQFERLRNRRGRQK